MSIRWIRNLIIDNEKTTIEVQFGESRIGDKCYTRIGNEVEQWFENVFETREDILRQGLDILKKRLASRTVTFPDGNPYDWR
jgi:hypothetical protein